MLELLIGDARPEKLRVELPALLINGKEFVIKPITFDLRRFEFGCLVKSLVNGASVFTKNVWLVSMIKQGGDVPAVFPPEVVMEIKALACVKKQAFRLANECTMELPPAPGRKCRVEFEYERNGSLSYIAAWDVHRAKIFGLCEKTTGIKPYHRLVDMVMQQEPYRSAPGG